MLKAKNLILIITTFVMIGKLFAYDSIIRKPLLKVNFDHLQKIYKVDVREIDFKPLQATGLHSHPCPVISYIVTGDVLFQVDGQAPRIVHAGEVLYEPADKKILHFDNHSSTQSLTFIAYYLLNKNQDKLITML